MGCPGICCPVVMHGEWYGVCDFVVLSVVDVCADYGGMNVFHVCLNFGVVNVCAVVCCLFLTSACCLLCCSAVGVWGVVIFVLSVTRVVGGVSVWVVSVFFGVLCTQLLF